MKIMASCMLRLVCKNAQIINPLLLQRLNGCQGCATNLYNLQQHRKTSFLTTVSAEQLWKGVTSVSNAGRKRGRGKGVGTKRAKDLNRGQMIGIGKINMVWPGLNSPVIRGREVVEQRELPPDPEREEKLIKLRDSMRDFAPLRLHPLERGWTGVKMPGRSLGRPDPIGEETFENFDCKVLEMRMVCCMKGNFGRTRRMRVMAVSGNKNGIVGIGMGKAADGRTAMKKAKNQSVQKLRYIDRFEEHTVYHDFYSEFHKTKLFVKKKPKGYGLVCHRILREICQMIGIKDIYVKVEKSTNPLSIVNAFLNGLQNQKTHQDLANEMGLHVVEFRKERDNFPQVIASPEQKKVRNRKEIPSNEITDYSEIINEGKVQVQKPKEVAFYKKLPSWEIRIRKTIHQRNFRDVRTRLRAEYGGLKSFLTIREEQANRERVKASTTDV